MVNIKAQHLSYLLLVNMRCFRSFGSPGSLVDLMVPDSFPAEEPQNSIAYIFLVRYDLITVEKDVKSPVIHPNPSLQPILVSVMEEKTVFRLNLRAEARVIRQISDSLVM